MEYKTVTDNYKFECTLCGNCCMGDTQIFLDFYDLYKMARFLNFSSSGELFRKGFVFLNRTENDIWRPQLRFKSKPFRFCPFLSNHLDEESGKFSGLCQLHPKNKPLVCATAPIGRRYNLQTQINEYIFHPPAPDCPGIHKDQQNSITDLEKEYQKELSYQLKTFQILEKVNTPHLQSKEETMELYKFTIEDNFDTFINNFINL